MNRRTITASRVAILLAAVNCTATTIAADTAAPQAPQQPVTDRYHGVSVADPYRWLEDWADPRVQQWSAAQNQRARSYLDALPYRKAIYDRLYREISATSASFYALRAAGGKIFALYNQPPKNQPMISVMNGNADPAQARIVVDPNTLNPKGTTAIDWYVPSPDGTLLAVSMSENGSEDGSVHIFAVDSGKQVYEVLPRVQYPTGGGSLAWRADSRGFWYTRYPGTERPEADRHFYMAVYFHELGKDPARDAYVFGKGLPKIAEIALSNRDNKRYVLASVANGDGGEFAHYLIDRDGRLTQITHFEDRVVAATLGADDNLYLISRQQAPRGKLLTLPAATPLLARARVLVPESDGALLSAGEAGGSPVTITERAIYLREIVGGPSRVEIFNHDGKRQGELPLPQVASVDELEALDDGSLLYGIETYPQAAVFLPLSRSQRQG